MTAGWRDDFETVREAMSYGDPYDRAAEALDRIQSTIEQQQARIEELEGHIRGIITGADLHPGELPQGLVNALPSLRTAINQNPPNPSRIDLAPIWEVLDFAKMETAFDTAAAERALAIIADAQWKRERPE